MTNQEKALIYDQCIRESDALQRSNSKMRAEYAGNIPSNISKIIIENEAKIRAIIMKVEALFND